MSKNGSITSFFKPVSKGSQNSPAPSRTSQHPVSSPWLGAPVSVPVLPSSPMSIRQRRAASPTPLARDAVIKGSDDEDDDDLSDDDLPDILALNRSKVPVPARRETNPCVTPKAKRTAVSFLASPLPNRVRHKFDLKALQDQARQSDATMASAQGVASLLEAEREEAEAELLRAKTYDTFDATIDSLLEVDKDMKKEGNHDRLRRAVKRTNATFSGRHWRFFANTPGEDAVAMHPPFPKEAATGRWEFLADTRHRISYFQEALPLKLQLKKADLPDEIFLWVWNQIPLEPSGILRDEYVRLVGSCAEQVNNLIDNERLDQLFLTLGASHEAVNLTSNLQPTTEPGDLEPEKGKSRLQSALRLLSRTSELMSIEALIHSVSIILRLGMDILIREDPTLCIEYGVAISRLVEAVPANAWRDFCDNICRGLFQSIEQPSLRWDALSTMPAAGVRIADLRQRLARAFVFDDLSEAYQDQEAVSVIREMIGRLQTPQFTITHDTDYVELKALILMLSVAIDNGCPPPASSTEVEKQLFNAEVDELAKLVRFRWSSVTEGGSEYLERLEVRSLLQNLECQLQYAVRTSRPPLLTIFDVPPDDDEEKYRPKQQEFMRSFLRKK